MSRIVNLTVLNGTFALPMGIRFLGHDIGDHPKSVEISTVCLENGHLEDPLSICEPEYGFETMVFLDDCTFFSLFTAKYATREDAARGHDSVVQNLLSGKLPLAIPLAYYRSYEVSQKVAV